MVRRPLPPLTFSPRGQGRRPPPSALGVALVIPHVVGAKLPIYITGMAYVILFASLGLLVRTSGQASLCHIAFAAVGASTAARIGRATASPGRWPS